MIPFLFQCESLLEDFESDIEDWYFNVQGEESLKTYLCSERALKGFDDSCLAEELPPLKGDGASLEDKSTNEARKPDEL